jgi:hypothetical protein
VGIFEKFLGKRKKIAVSGSWTAQLWKNRPVTVDVKPDIAAFFTQIELPYLWPDDKKYINYIDSQSNPQEHLRIQWSMVYLHHPNVDVVVEVLRAVPKLFSSQSLGVITELADLLTHRNSEVRKEAAQTIWKCSDVVLKTVFNVLGSKGVIPSGITPQDAKRGAELLREFCPPTRSQIFQQLASETFGPTFAGVPPTPSPRVQFKTKFSTPAPLGAHNTYEVYTAKSKLEALQFLEQKQVMVPLYYIVVETPEGNWGKDQNGIYQEK